MLLLEIKQLSETDRSVVSSTLSSLGQVVRTGPDSGRAKKDAATWVRPLVISFVAQIRSSGLSESKAKAVMTTQEKLKEGEDSFISIKDNIASMRDDWRSDLANLKNIDKIASVDGTRRTAVRWFDEIDQDISVFEDSDRYRAEATKALSDHQTMIVDALMNVRSGANWIDRLGEALKRKLAAVTPETEAEVFKTTAFHIQMVFGMLHTFEQNAQQCIDIIHPLASKT